MNRVRFFTAVGAVLVVFAVLVPAGGAATAPPPSGGPIARAAHPQNLNRRESTSSFGGVSCVSTSFCMAVGGFKAENTELPLAERWDGHAWSFSTEVVPAGSSTLNSVSCVSVDFCMAVGAGSGGAVALKWNGSSWSAVDVASGYDNAAFFGVSCPTSSECVAVGETTSGSAQALIEYWLGGSTFTLGTAANEAGVDLPLRSGARPRSACPSAGMSRMALRQPR